MESLTTRFDKRVLTPYIELLRAQYKIHPTFAYAKATWEQKLTPEELVNGPFLERAQIYETGDPIEKLGLHPLTVETLRQRLSGRLLYKHQTDALNLLVNGKNAVIATGTSSGKTLCYQIPILDDLVKDSSPGLRAVIIYPLNALVNDQLTEWEQLLKGHRSITFGRFTGQTPGTQIDYEERLKFAIREQLSDQGLTQQELQQELTRRLADKLRRESADAPNRFNTREHIRRNPPHILVTNFSMLEYLLERPIDAPIFENAHLKFLVLDEAHAYRGVQSTEIAFLIRRLKDRLGVESLTCIATSATLGKPGEAESSAKVRRFASDLFGENFSEENPIYGKTAKPQLRQPSVNPSPTQYISAIAALRENKNSDAQKLLGMDGFPESFPDIIERDQNLFRLRKDILSAPKLLQVAAKELWPTGPDAIPGLLALLEIVATAKSDESRDDLLPTRLHYFVKAQDGLHVCLHRQCPGRKDGQPAFFVSRQSDAAPIGQCPECFPDRKSQLVEVVTCRKCGYLFGALQDLGPRRARNTEARGEGSEPGFDSFSTELGWSADSFWSYFSVETELPYPPRAKTSDEEEEDEEDLLFQPVELDWCAICGKKKDNGAGDNCSCERPHLRTVKIFHRQCPSDKYENLYSQQKRLLTYCPNCGVRNGSGLEPLRRFQESDDEIGLAMAIPLAHFQVSMPKGDGKPPRKLLCFTDHRQRAAAFPSLLEDEAFGHDLGRKIVKILAADSSPLDLVTLGERLADIADQDSDRYDSDFFLPTSRLPDEPPTAKEQRDLWIAEVFDYFGIPDSARESAEDVGLVQVEYRLREGEQRDFHALIGPSRLALQDSNFAIQVLLGFIRQRKAFTLPKGRVEPDAPAFGRFIFDKSYVRQRKGIRNTEGWLPQDRKDRTYRDNIVTDYLRRLLKLPPREAGAVGDEIWVLADKTWQFLTERSLLVEERGRGNWKLDHERMTVRPAVARNVCKRCSLISAYSALGCCPRKACEGPLSASPFDSSRENIIARWVAGSGEFQFAGLKSEEHTAQINKDIAKAIEESFRGQGINLLSSTTTFEMGINIGDLQKVLLRNAPPTSASYVQRVGRAGRGGDKNSICVTLCRRTKYDADAWSDPPRLMSGAVRAPTVFTLNKVMAQRHFNATAFAKFLRIKIANEQVLGSLGQQIRLEAFLPLEARNGIPEAWFQIRPANLLLDFAEWLRERTEADIFQTSAGRSLLAASRGIEMAKATSGDGYQEVLKEIADELSALMEERKSLQSKGEDSAAADIGRAVRALLASDVIAVLAKRGFLPRYAFPLDVVTLETGRSRWISDTEVELSRDRGIAIAEFAPQAQVIAHKRIFTSAGLYIMGKSDAPKKQWFSKCLNCEQIRTAPTQERLIGPCQVCGRAITPPHTQAFVEPEAFSVRIDKKAEGAERFRRNSLVRQRHALTYFIDSVENQKFAEKGLFSLALKEEGRLFRYNQGPNSKGFMLCPVCGCSEPMHGLKAGRGHKRLRVYAGNMACTNPRVWPNLAYGHQFQSFCLIARPMAGSVPVESLAYALQRGVCSSLDIETSDIGVSWRWMARRAEGARMEFILYDLAPGGAGFVKEAFENWDAVVQSSLRVCESCKCESACYDCLKSYGNQAFHDKLNRRDVVSFIKSVSR